MNARDGPRGHQDRSKRGPRRRPRMGFAAPAPERASGISRKLPGTPQTFPDAPQRPQYGPRSLQDAPRDPQEAPQERLRDPESPHSLPKPCIFSMFACSDFTASKTAQEASKTAPEASKGIPNRPKRDPGRTATATATNDDDDLSFSVALRGLTAREKYGPQAPEGRWVLRPQMAFRKRYVFLWP